jgi:Ca2+-binding RTX toxin-like protein
MSDTARFKVDVRDTRALAAFSSRLSRYNHQQFRNPDRPMPGRYINVANDVRFRGSSLYNMVLDNINTKILAPANHSHINTTAGAMNLLVHAFVDPAQPHVYVISIGQGGLYTSPPYDVNGKLDLRSQAAIMAVATLRSSILAQDHSAQFVLTGAYNGGTLANVVSSATGLPTQVFNPVPLDQRLITAASNFSASRASDALFAGLSPTLDPTVRRSYTTFELGTASFESVIRVGSTNGFGNYQNSQAEGIPDLIDVTFGGLKNLLGGRSFLRGMSDASFQNAGTETLDLAFSPAPNPEEIRVGTERVNFALWDLLSVGSPFEWAFLEQQGDVDAMILGTTEEQLIVEFLPRTLMSNDAVLQQALSDQNRFKGWNPADVQRELASAVQRNPGYMEELLRARGGFNEATSDPVVSGFVMRYTDYGRFNPALFLSDAIALPPEHIEQFRNATNNWSPEFRAQFNRVLENVVAGLVRRGAEPQPTDILEVYRAFYLEYNPNEPGNVGRLRNNGLLSVFAQDELVQAATEGALQRQPVEARRNAPTCFPDGTQVLAPGGIGKAIEGLAEGDAVFCYDPEKPGGKLVTGTVTGHRVLAAAALLKINDLVCTGDHELLRDDGRFSRADQIQLGDRLVDAAGAPVAVDRIETIPGARVHSISVEPYPTFVAEGYRVHNEALCDWNNSIYAVDANLSIRFTSFADGRIGIEYINGNGVVFGERLIDGDLTLTRIWEEYDEMTGTETPDEAGVRRQLAGNVPKEIYEYELQKYNSIEEFGAVGNAIGSILGSRLAGKDALLNIGLSAVLGTALENLFESVRNGGAWGKLPLSELPILDNIGTELAGNAIGSASSYLLGEIIAAAGVKGIPAQVLQTGAGTIISTISQNIINGVANPFEGIGGGLANAAGSFIGSTLAAQIHSFDTIGGQIGSALGSSIGSIVAGSVLRAVLPKFFEILGTGLGGPVGAAIGAFVGYFVGGIIGSLIGGIPRSGADTSWDEEKGQFVVSNVYSKKGGRKDAATTAAGAVADSLNAIIEATGGTLLDPQAIQSGNYGMRKQDFVYRPVSTRDKSAITKRFTGDNGLADLINYGTHSAITDGAFKLYGGNIYLKRALYNYVDRIEGDFRKLDMTELTGDFSSAAAFSNYLQNFDFANRVVAAHADKVVAAEFALMLSRADDLGLRKRHASDWFGGWQYLQETAGVSLDSFSFNVIIRPADRTVERVIDYDVFTLSDTIDVAAQTVIEGTNGAETVILTHHDTRADGARVAGGVGRLASTAGLRINGVDGDGSALTIEVAATIDVGGGDDVVHGGDLGNNIIGGGGNDVLYGGRLDDWLLGGDGNDLLHAGDVSANLAGDGNYLHGGAGNDRLYGREGSDWLEGGDGTDILEGGDGDDILAGGGGDGDSLKGGRGNDQYLVRLGDGAGDVVDEVATATVVRDTTRGTINWLGDEADLELAFIRNRDRTAGSTERFTAAVSADGDDAIVFGAGIEMGDLELKRSGTEAAPGSDLMIKVKSEDGSFSEIAVKDWFTDPVKRIEWLKFADGNEIRIGDTVNFIVGTPGNDLIIGTEYADFVVAGDGDDEVHLLGGDDFGSGGTGDDILFGDGDRDIIVGGLGRDTLHGGLAADMLSGDAGGDEIDGGEGDDTISGGRGDDRLKGGAGNDVFKFSRGDGRDSIVQEEVVSTPDEALWVDMTDANGRLASGYSYDPDSGELIDSTGYVLREDIYYGGSRSLSWRVPLRYSGSVLQRYTGAVSTSAVAAGSDRIAFEVGINVQDLVFDTSGPDLIIGIGRENDRSGTAADSADRITIRDWNGPSAPGGRPVKEMAFYQAGTVDLGANGKVLKGGTAGDDSLSGGAGQDWITGAGGRDTLAGGDSDDILSGGGGDDRLEGEAGADVLYGGGGQDELAGGLGDDVLSGGDDNDMLEGGAGADLLAGGGGDDTVSFAASSSGVAASLRDRSLNSGDAAGDEYDSIENLTGSGSADSLFGDEGDNVLEGGGGHDFLRGEEGDDVYLWARGDGDDVVAEGFEEVFTAAGTLGPHYSEQWSCDPVWVSNTPDGPPQLPTAYTGDPSQDGGYFEYRWSLSITGAAGETVFAGGPWVGTEGAPPRETALAGDGWRGGFARTGDGQQVARGSADAAASGSDSLEFGEGISLSHLSFEVVGDDLVIGIAPDDSGAGAGRITLRNQGTTGGTIETLQFHDGQAVPLSQLRLHASGQDGREGSDDLVVGDAQDNILSGGSGDDVLYGGGGVNLLSGGSGDDLFEGGAGIDHFQGNTGAEDTVRYAGSGAGVQASLIDGAGPASGGSAAGDTFANVENLTGSAHSDTLVGNALDNELIGLGGDNHLSGNGGDDVLTALGGDDMLDGGEGDDALSGGDGTDVLIGGGGNDVLDGGSGSDTLAAGAGDDQLLGGDGGGTLDGGTGNDLIVGGSGADTMLGGEGADVLTGHGGGDSLQGGDGDDQYVFEAGSGIDTISDGSGKNVILFGGDIDRSRLWLTREGDHLRIGVVGSDHVVQVDGFFAASGTVSRVSSVQAGEYTLFLNGPKGQALIQRMTTADPTPAPIAMNAAIGTDLDLYWSKGNTGPENIALAAGEIIAVAEGTAAIATAGAAPRFVATDGEGDSFLWSMVNDAGGRFGIDAQTGTLYVLNAAALDFESAPGHSLTIRATDAQGAFTDHMFTVAVTDRNDRPDTPVLEAGGGTVPEGGSWFARFRLQDQDGAPVLELVDNPGGLFAVVGNEVRFAAGAAPDFETLIEAGGSTVVDSDGDGLGEIVISGTVRASDGIENTDTVTVTAVVEDVNESPADMVLLERIAGPIAERDRLATDSGPGATGDNRPALVLGKVQVADADHPTQKSGQYTYRVFENGSAVASQRFAVVNGELQLLAGKSLDYETDGASIDVRIAATDFTLAPAFSKTFTFAISDQMDVLGGDEGNNDPLTGQSGQDLILGYGGNDVLVGGTGPDTLDGGSGTDIASYSRAPGAISADLELKTVLADGATDTLISIEGVRGSAFADTLQGSSGSDVLQGGGGGDLLDGRGGADSMTGGTGNDVYVVNDIGDQVIELAGEGQDEVWTALASYTLADNVEKLFGTSTTITQHLKDNALDNMITGTAVTDWLYISAGGNDTVYGKEGNDVFVVGGGGGALTADDRLDGGTGTDTILFHGSANILLTAEVAANIENLSFQTGPDTLYGPGGLYTYSITIADSMVLAGAQMRVNGSPLVAGETMIFDGSAETDGSFFIFAGRGRDDLKGGARDDIFQIYAGTYQLHDRIEGGAGTDQIQFRAGITASLGETAMSSIENFLLLSGGAAPSAYDLTLSNGNVAGTRTLTVDGTGLNASEGFILNGAAEMDGQLVLKGGAGNDVLTGGAGADTLTGGLGNDTLSGGAGADQMAGGVGNDLYIVDDAADGVTETAGEGTDEVRTGLADYKLADNVEKLTGTSGAAGQILRDNARDNIITAGALADSILIESGGEDVVSGGGGNDYISFGKTFSAGDRVDGGAGTDGLVFTGSQTATFGSASFTNVETYLVLGSSDPANPYSYVFTGNDGNVAAGTTMTVTTANLVAGDSLTFDGSAETDGRFFFYAGVGREIVTGGAGDDGFWFRGGTYDASNDKVAGGAGTDQLTLGGGITAAFAANAMTGIESIWLLADTGLAAASYLLTSSDGNVAAGQALKVEATALRAMDSLKFDGSAETNGAFQLIGGAGDDKLTAGAGADSLTGGDGNDLLDGRLGGDTMRGGKGDDVYVVDDALDIVTEAEGEGAADHVQTSLRTYTLGDGLENLTSTVADGATSFTANAADNVITTGAASDRIVLFTGGKDIVSTGTGSDGVIFLGKHFDSEDRIDLGDGRDQLSLRGSVTATFREWQLVGVESLAILSGLHSGYDIPAAELVLAHYNLTTIDANVGADASLTADAAQTIIGETVRFDGRAETDGAFVIAGGGGTDTFFGGARDDTFTFKEGSSGIGNFGNGDMVDGGSGTDKLQLRSAYTIAFASGAMTSIETLELLSGVPRGGTYNYDITMADGNVVAGALLTVDAASLAATEGLNFDGTAESNGRFLVTGGAGNDVVRGGSGIDTINTGAGNDLIHLRGVGEDIVDGGGDVDTVSFAGVTTALSVNLASDTKLLNVENVIGTALNDTIKGSDSVNRLEGGAGDDTLEGGAGADQLVGGAGFDTVTYENASGVSAAESWTGAYGNVTLNGETLLAAQPVTYNGIRASLRAAVGTASIARQGEAQGDQYAGIEKVVGTSHNDMIAAGVEAAELRGGAGHDYLQGGIGNDVLHGDGGDDVLYGHDGEDDLYGGAGDDRLFGEGMDDDLHGGAGDDHLVGGSGNDTYHFKRGEGNDRIYNYDAGGFDHLSMGDDIFHRNIWFERVTREGAPSDNGIDLRLTVLGAGGHEGTVTITDWFRTGTSAGVFTVDLITDSGARATVPADVDRLIALMKGKARPTNQQGMNAYLVEASFFNGLEEGWRHLSAPTLEGVLDVSTVEPLDSATGQVTLNVRAHYVDTKGLGLVIPSTNIDVELVTTNGQALSAYVAAFNPGTPDSAGNRTVVLTLTPNGSTHLLAGGKLPLEMRARLRGVVDSTGALIASSPFNLTIAPTADTPTLTGSSAGGNTGTYIPVALVTDTPDKDGSEKVDVLVGGVPAGYSLTNAAGTAVGTWTGYDPSAKSLSLVTAKGAVVADKTGGVFEIASISSVYMDNSVVSTTGFAGDFVLRARGIRSETYSIVGMNSDPRENTSYTSMDHAIIIHRDGQAYIFENGSMLGSVPLNGQVWMWRKGSTLQYGVGPDFATASLPINVFRTVENVTGTLYFDSSFGIGNNAAEVQVVETATRLTPAELSGLRLFAPTGRSQDATLNITPVSVDGSSTRHGAAYAVKVAVNAAPTDIATRGAGTAPALNISEATATNNPIGKVVGIATATDPDALDRNLLSTDFSQLPRVGAGEERIAYAAGPNGPIVQVLETGQQAGIVNSGSGVPGATLSEPLDSSKAYKFTVFVKVDTSLGHSFYFGADAALENAMTGAASQGGGFAQGSPNTLQSGRWYRLEGYVLPAGHELLAGQDLLGGIFDVATGQKVADATTFRFASTAQAVKLNLITYGNEQNVGFSTQWTQPQVEKLEYKYELVGTNPLFKVNPVTGAIIATGNAIDYEAAQSHNVTVRVIDRSTNPTVDPVGLVKDKAVTIAVNNLNEPNSFPATPPTGFGANENAIGEIVGTVQATDIDSSATPFGQQAYGFWNPTTQAFTATSTDGRYTIDAVTGQIRTAMALNYETTTAPVSYWVAARDNNGVGSYFQTQMQISLAVRDVNEPNSLPASYGMSVNENVGVGTAVGTVTATDLDLASTANGQQRYYFYSAGAVSSVSSDSRYTIDAITGQIKTNSALNFEAGNTSVSYTIAARDNQGSAGTGAIFRDSFEELAVPTIGHKSDGGNAAMYRVANAPSQGNGALRAAMAGSHTWTFPGSSFVAAQSTVTLSVMVRDSGVTNASIASGWSGSNVDAAHPVLLGLHNEITDAWVYATNATATKPPNGGAWVRHVQTITGLTVGQTYTVSAMMGAYEGVRASDIDALQVEYGSVATSFVGWSQAFTTATIGINNVNEAPLVSNPPATRFADEAGVGSSNPAQSGTVFATYALSDPDGTVPSLQFASNPGNWFAIAGNQVKFAFNFDFEWARSNGFSIADYNGDGRLDAYIGIVSVQAADGSLSSASAGTHFYLSDVNERPGAMTLQSQTLHSETIPGDVGHQGKTIASFSVSDPDGTTPSIAILGGNAYGMFATSGGNLNFAQANFTSDWLRSTLGAYGQDAGWYYDADGDGLKEIRVATLTLAAVDSAGLQGDPFTYNVFIEDKNERPNALTLQSQTLHSETLPGEAGHPGKTIASFALSDPDGTAPSLAIVGGNTYGWFTTSGGSLNFTGANFTADWLRSTLGAYGQDSGWNYDIDGDGLREIRVATLALAAVDSRGLQGDSFTYNVLIEDKNEAPNWNAAAYSFAINENPASYAWVGTVAGSDVDGPAGELRYGFADWSIYYDGNIGYVSRSPDGRFLINSQNGHVYVNGAQALDYEGQRSFSYSTRVFDRAAGAYALSAAATLAINLQNLNDSATWYSQVPVDFTVTENTAVGTIVSDGVRAADADGFGISYSIDQVTNPNGAFGVNASGQIYVAGAIDHESANWLADGSGKFANLRILASDGGAAAVATIKINIGNIRKYVYNNGALDHNLYEIRSQSTYTGGGYEGGYEGGYGGGIRPTMPGGYGSSWFNECWLVERSTGLVLSWMGEYSQWEGTTSRPFPHAGSLAEGYVGSGTYPNPYTMYADREDIMSGIDGIPQGSPYYPIVFDLGGDGFDLSRVMESGVTTDLNEDGIVEGSGWVKASDGFLVLDRNGDGLVLDWNEISFVKDKAGASTDLEGLVAFDSNGDLKLGAGDSRFGEFRLWVDANQDGIGQAAELRSLGDAGIVSVSLVRQDIKPASGSITVNSVLATAAFERSDGTVGRVGDVALARLPQRGPEPEPGAPKFRFDQMGASSAAPGPANRGIKHETDGPIESGNDGTMAMNMSQATEARRTASAAVAGSTVTIGRNVMRATSTSTRADGSISSVGDIALASRVGKPAKHVDAMLRQVAADLGSGGDAAEESVDERLGEKLEALRAGLNLRPFLSLAPDRDSLFEHYFRPDPASKEQETKVRRMDLPSLRVAAPDGGLMEGDGAALHVAPAADDLRVAKMVQDMAGFGLRSGESEWKARAQARPNFDYFA